jgi:hypothetical protein
MQSQPLSFLQGDQIGRIFAHWASVYIEQVFCFQKEPECFAYFLPLKKLCINFVQKMGWATFWAIFSQSHLGTLVSYE